MDISQIVKSTQEQAVSAWINRLNQLRLDELISSLFAQDINLEDALNELQELKNFVARPEHILGNLNTKHGEIAEHVQVNIANARRFIDGLLPEYTFDGVGRTAPEDYLFHDIKVQSKYLNGLVNTLTGKNGVAGHLLEYPDFLRKGHIYHIPKDQFEEMQRLLAMSEDEVKKASQEVRRVILKLEEFQRQTGIDLSGDRIQPAIGKYDEVQLGNIDETIEGEEGSLRKKDQENRDKAHQQSKPSLQEGLKATAVSAALEGGVTFCLEVARKLKSGKKLSEFTPEDWRDVGIDTAVGGGKGAIRGASIYALTNFTATPAAAASAVVTAAFGMTAQARFLQQGKISNEDFVVNSEVVCLDAAVSAISSLLGDVIIPIPVLGAVIGNAVGMFMYGLAKDKLSKQEQTLIAHFNRDIQQLNEQLDANYAALIERLAHEFAKFKSVLALAYDVDVNMAFVGSIAMAQYVGCSKNQVLWDKQDVDRYFLD